MTIGPIYQGWTMARRFTRNAKSQPRKARTRCGKSAPEHGQLAVKSTANMDIADMTNPTQEAASLAQMIREWMTGPDPLSGDGLERVIEKRLARLRPAGDAGVSCAACEGRPSGTNNPCAVCGRRALPSPQPPEQEAVRDKLRAQGWRVAVHNDYRLNGVDHTFWLFTHPDGRYCKGEGRSDEEALQSVLATALASAKPEGWRPTYRHKKRGTTYRVLHEARMQVDGDMDYERVVVYQGEDGSVWVRPSYEFDDGRFEEIAAAPAEEVKP